MSADHDVTEATPEVDKSAFDKAAVLAGAVGLVSPVFALTTSGNNNFVAVANLGLVVFLVLGALAVVGGLTGQSLLALGAGVGFSLAALLQLVQLDGSPNWLDGRGSTMALYAGLGLALVIVGWVGHRLRPAGE